MNKIDKSKINLTSTLEFLKKHKANIIQYGGLIFVIILFAILTGGKIFSSYNLTTLIGQITPLLIMSIGMMFIFAHGSFDISCGAVAGACSLVMVLIANATGSMFLGIIVAIVLAVILYVGSCLISIKFGLMSTISSLAIMFGARGLVTYVCSLHDGVIKLEDYGLISDLKSNWILQLVICVIVVLVGIILFNYTKIGKQAKAIGDNPLSAQQSGTNINKIKLLCYLIGGILVGVASMFILARAGSIGKSIGSGAEMDVMVSIILGGMALSGGSKSKISAAVIGTITYRLLSNGMTMSGVPTSYISLVKGIIFIIIILLTLRQSKNIKEMPR